MAKNCVNRIDRGNIDEQDCDWGVSICLKTEAKYATAKKQNV